MPSRFVPVCVIFVLGFSASTFAEEPVRAPRLERAATEVSRLSELLPPSFAEFVLQAGSDREVEAAGSLVLRFNLDDATVGDVLDLLRPRQLVEASKAVTIGNPVEAKRGERFREKPQLLLIAGTDVVLEDGTIVPFGGELVPGDRIEQGLVLNAGNRPVVFWSPIGDEMVIEPGGAVAAKCATECSVEGCGGGSFACCWIDGGCAVCRCRTSEPPGGCNAGGPNSTGCSINVRTR